MSRKPITCREVVATLDDYCSGGLSPERQRVVEEHLSGCEKCAAYLESYRATVEAAKGAFAEEEGADDVIPEVLVKSILRGRRH